MMPQGLGARLAAWAGLAAAYAVVAHAGLLLASVNDSASPVWPATGLAIAALLLLGPKAWPGVLVGATVANWTNGTPILVSAAIGAGNTLEAVVAAALVRRWAHGPAAFAKVDDVVRFAWIAALATTVSATVGVAAVTLGGASPWSAAGAAWATWWLGDTVGALVVTPLIVLWVQDRRLHYLPARAPEAAALLVCAAALGGLLVTGMGPAWLVALPFGLLLLGPVAWAAFRFGPREAVTVSAVLCAVAVWATTLGNGPFENPSTNDSLLLVQSLIGAVTVTGLVMGLVVAERDRTQAALRRAQDGLELGIRLRTGQLDEVIGRLQGVTEGVPLGIFHTDTEGRIDYANLQWMRMSGCADLDPAAVAAAVHPDDRPALASAWRMALPAGAEVAQEFRFLRGGEARLVSMRATPVRDGDGRVTGYVGCADDVTERRAAEEGLRRTNSLLHATLEATQDGILVVDRQGRILSHNHQFAAMWRIPPEVLAAHDDARAVAAVLDQLEDAPGFVAKVQDLYGRPHEESFDLLRFRDGRVFERFSKPQWLGAEVVGRVWSFRDVTQRRAAEGALQESEERSRLLIDSMKDHAMCLVDTEGRVVSWNPGAERVTGYTASDVLGRHVARFYTPEDQAAGRPAAALRTASATGRFEEERQRVRKDGSRFWADVVVTALRGADGSLRGFSNVTRDVTERKQAQAQAREVGRLSELHTFKEGFLRNAAHELGTPLTPIKLQVRVLRSLLSQRPGSRESHSVDILDRNIERLHVLVRDMLEAARLQSGRMALKPRAMDLAHAVHDVADTFQEAAIHAGIRLDVQGPAALPLEADPDRVGQVLYNLVSNAMKFTPPGGHVAVLVRQGTDGASVTVRDTGSGLTPEQEARLFQPFVQVHDTNERPLGGSGLGLYISRGIAESHGGSLAVRSAGPGHGCEFTLHLPMVAMEAAPALRAPSAGSALAAAPMPTLPSAP